MTASADSPLGAPDVERPGGTFGPLGRDGWNSTIIELPIFARIGAAHVSPYPCSRSCGELWAESPEHQ